jgi:addiction module RelE/StbE family toxin
VKRVLIRTAAFIRAAKRHVKRRPEALSVLREILIRLEADAFDSRLRTHKLKGDLAGCWACSGGYDLRIVFQILEHQGRPAILLLSVGTHDEVY